jgi:hypothetical protein
MAATTIGTANLTFGLTAETGGLVQSFSEARNVEKQEVRNQVGDVTGVAFYNATTAYSMSITTTGGYLTTTAGAAISLQNAVSSTGSTRIDSLTINRSNDGFVTVDISATGYPNVS